MSGVPLDDQNIRISGSDSFPNRHYTFDLKISFCMILRMFFVLNWSSLLLYKNEIMCNWCIKNKKRGGGVPFISHVIFVVPLVFQYFTSIVHGFCLLSLYLLGFFITSPGWFIDSVCCRCTPFSILISVNKNNQMV